MPIFRPIQQIVPNEFVNNLFHIFQSGSGCKGEVKAGELKPAVYPRISMLRIVLDDLKVSPTRV